MTKYLVVKNKTQEVCKSCKTLLFESGGMPNLGNSSLMGKQRFIT